VGLSPGKPAFQLYRGKYLCMMLIPCLLGRPYIGPVSIGDMCSLCPWIKKICVMTCLYDALIVILSLQSLFIYLYSSGVVLFIKVRCKNGIFNLVMGVHPIINPIKISRQGKVRKEGSYQSQYPLVRLCLSL
jgi:hypothetical protein